jgi:hypothetical protein
MLSLAGALQGDGHPAAGQELCNPERLQWESACGGATARSAALWLRRLQGAGWFSAESVEAVGLEPAVAAGKAHPWLVWNGHPLCPPCPFVCHVIMCPIKQCCARHVQCAATWVERKQLACANGASAARWLVSGAAIVPRCNHVTEDSCTCLVERVVCNGPWYGQLYDVISGAALPPSMHSS